MGISPNMCSVTSDVVAVLDQDLLNLVNKYFPVALSLYNWLELYARMVSNSVLPFYVDDMSTSDYVENPLLLQFLIAN